MRITLRQGSSTFELIAGAGVQGGGFRHAGAAATFLRAFQRDNSSMTQLRKLAVHVTGSRGDRLSDATVLRLLSDALASGRVRLGGAAARTNTMTQANAPAEDAPIPTTPRPTSSSTSASEPSMFDANFDAAAQAAVLKQAAADGVPFCEECERLRREREAA